MAAAAESNQNTDLVGRSVKSFNYLVISMGVLPKWNVTHTRIPWCHFKMSMQEKDNKY